MKLVRSLSVVLFTALLVACAGRPPAPGSDSPSPEQLHEERVERLLASPGWSLTGRLGLQRGEEGGSGRLDWTVREDSASLAFRGTLGQGAWRLAVTPDFARLELKDGTVREAPRVEDLVLDQTGWEAPVTALAWWVRGLAWPDGPEPVGRRYNADGTLATLDQAGWNIVWTRYTDRIASQRLPDRMELSREDVRIKLAISRWSLIQPSSDAAAMGEVPGDG